MAKKAVDKTTSTNTVEKAKRVFFMNLLDLSWRLFVAILVPILIGSFLDNRFDTGSLFTLLGLFAGITISIWVIRATVIKVNKETA